MELLGSSALVLIYPRFHCRCRRFRGDTVLVGGKYLERLSLGTYRAIVFPCCWREGCRTN